MLQLNWHSVTIETNQQANAMIALFNEIKPKVGAFDTETDGLHIILNKPFVVQFGFIHPDKPEGYTYAVDLERQPKLARAVINAWNTLAKNLQTNLGQNIKFDLHMLTNIGLPYSSENVSDSMFYIRYAHDNLTPKYGGPPLGLKDYATRYIDHRAKTHEKLLDAERTQIAKDLNLKLKMRLRNCGTPPAKYGAKSYTLSVINEMFSDPIFEYTDLPENIQQPYLDWLQQDVPVYLQNKIHGVVDSEDIPYNILNRANLIRYAHYDIIYTVEVYLKLKDTIVARGNEEGLRLENSLILDLYAMERTGFKADIAYLEDCRKRTKAYIKDRRRLFHELAGRELKTGQHELIKYILNNDYGVNCVSTNADELDLLKSDLIIENPEHPAIEFIGVIQELRTLEKWYSTYIIRFQKNLQYTDKLYTTINQVGTVSGRVTSDFQQFPKDPIVTITGEELFHPRRLIIHSGEEYHGIVYLDFSQIELRFQAIYTILVGHPDLNLCRAYMPYKCINNKGELFDYNNIEHIRNWEKEWYYEEDPSKHWTPTDLHGTTTEAATGLSSEHPDFKKLRTTIGKRTNFAKNYGAKYNKIRQMFPQKTVEECRKIDQAYDISFPGVKFYQDYCYARAQEYAATTNLFGIKYYGASGHKLINMLIQGSAAYYLKIKEKEICDHLKRNGYKSRWQMQIHDELSFEWHKDDPPELFFEIKHIMEDWNEALVPIVAEMDVTTTTWADKKGVHTLNELLEAISETSNIQEVS